MEKAKEEKVIKLSEEEVNRIIEEISKAPATFVFNSMSMLVQKLHEEEGNSEK